LVDVPLRVRSALGTGSGLRRIALVRVRVLLHSFWHRNRPGPSGPGPFVFLHCS
jgi:hypothetical protein